MAELARLRLTGGECDRLTGELNEILALVDRLDDLPEQQREEQRELEDPPEPTEVQELQQAQKPPEPEEVQEEEGGASADAKLPDALHRSIAEFAPRSEESFFLVPKLSAHDDPGDSSG